MRSRPFEVRHPALRSANVKHLVCQRLGFRATLAAFRRTGSARPELRPHPVAKTALTDDAPQPLCNAAPPTHGVRPARGALLRLSSVDPLPICQFLRRDRCPQGKARDRRACSLPDRQASRPDAHATRSATTRREEVKQHHAVEGVALCLIRRRRQRHPPEYG
jgi:hypothetical protein